MLSIIYAFPCIMRMWYEQALDCLCVRFQNHPRYWRLMKILWFRLLFIFPPNKLKASVWIRCCVALISNPLPFSWVLLTSFSKQTFNRCTGRAFRLIESQHCSTRNASFIAQVAKPSKDGPFGKETSLSSMLVFLGSLKCTLEFSCLYLSHWSQVTKFIQSSSIFLFICGPC
jgi:hypothetical protein